MDGIQNSIPIRSVSRVACIGPGGVGADACSCSEGAGEGVCACPESAGEGDCAGHTQPKRSEPEGTGEEETSANS